MTKAPRLAWFAWIAVCIIWGTTYLGIRVALESIPPALMAGFRWTIAGTILATVVLARGGSMPPRRTWPGLALMGLLMIGFGNGFVVWAEQFVPSGLTAVVIATSPFWMVSSEAVFGGDRLGRARSRASLLALRASCCSCGQTCAPAVRTRRSLPAVSWRFKSPVRDGPRARRSRSGTSKTTSWPRPRCRCFSAACSCSSIGTLAGEWQRLAFTPRTAGALTYLTLAGSLGAFLAYSYALRHLPVSTVSLYAYINPIIAVVLGALLLGEPFGSRVIAAAALVLAGLALVRYASAHPSRSAHRFLAVTSNWPAPALDVVVQPHSADRAAARALGMVGPRTVRPPADVRASVSCC